MTEQRSDSFKDNSYEDERLIKGDIIKIGLFLTITVSFFRKAVERPFLLGKLKYNACKAFKICLW